jgi:hypothetical protein
MRETEEMSTEKMVSVIYLPGKLELQVAFMEAFPELGLVSTEVSAFDDSGILEEYHLKSITASGAG